MEQKEEALEKMKQMYEKLDKSEMPTWNGIRNSTASAVESGSVQAKELQNRILNDVNKALLDSSKEQTILQKTLVTAMNELVKMSDPRYVGGSTGG
jgi:hypothetical protein